MKRGGPKRDWKDARAKVDREGRCRVCGTGWALEAAHVVGRAHDRPREGTSSLWVDPDSIVPLCQRDHGLYDAHRLDLLPYLTVVEQARAVVDAGGLELARVRTCPGAYRATTEEAA